MGKELKQTFIQSIKCRSGAGQGLLGGPSRQARAPSDFNLQPLQWTGSKQICVLSRALVTQSSSPLMRLILVLGPRTGVSNMWLEPFAAQGGPLACPVTSHLLGHPLGLQVQIISLFPSYKIICIFSLFFFYSLVLGRATLLVFWLFSELYVVVGLLF